MSDTQPSRKVAVFSSREAADSFLTDSKASDVPTCTPEAVPFEHAGQWLLELRRPALPKDTKIGYLHAGKLRV